MIDDLCGRLKLIYLASISWRGGTSSCDKSIHVQIRVLEIGFWARSSHRFLKHLVKFRNWGAEVALDFYRAISKTRISTVLCILFRFRVSLIGFDTLSRRAATGCRYTCALWRCAASVCVVRTHPISHVHNGSPLSPVTRGGPLSCIIKAAAARGAHAPLAYFCGLTSSDESRWQLRVG